MPSLPALPILLMILGTLASFSELAMAQEPSPYQATYAATSSGLSATAERKLEFLTDERYRLTQRMEVRVLGVRLGTVEESSVFRWVGEGLQPEVYSYEQSGVSDRNENVRFDWQQLRATSTEDDENWTLTLVPGVVDNLSFQLLMRQRLADPTVEELKVQLVDGDEIESHLYRVTGSEVIETGLGRLDTLRVERIRREGSRRQTIFWLARDWQMLLARFEQKSSSGATTTLLLEQATINGQEVTSLP